MAAEAGVEVLARLMAMLPYTILTTCCEEAHASHSGTMLGQEAFREYKTALLEVSSTFCPRDRCLWHRKASAD